MEPGGNAAGDNAVAADSNSRNLTPVAPDQTGEGLPYAPENWPNPGDVWSWRTGQRHAATGYFKDRYLYPPPHLCRAANSGSSRRRVSFASKLAVQRFVKELFPDANLQDFFASFSWRIPALCSGNEHAQPIAAVPLQYVAQEEQLESDSPSDIVACKAGNRRCQSLVSEEEKEEKYPPAMPCDICCERPGFCRECCCLLCEKTLDLAYGGYSYIRCQTKIGDNICGHANHLVCALRCLMAGTVGGSIGLDAEYWCRRCDANTDLIPHVNKLLQTCEAIDEDDGNKKKILKLGVCLLRGSERAIAKELMSRIELAISKFKCGTNTEDITNVVDNLTFTDHSAAGSSDNSNAKEGHLDVIIGTEDSGYLPDSLKPLAEVDHVLEDLRKSQEYEYNLAEGILNEHKRYLQNLYKQLESEKLELASQAQSSRSDVLVHDVIRERTEQIRREVMKFEEMKKIARGFGSTSTNILQKHFGL